MTEHRLTESEARRIASEWHGGQWSALYAFSSSGHRDADRLRAEIDECLDLSLYSDAPPDTRQELRALRAYIVGGGTAC